MQYAGMLTPEEGAALGIPSSTFVISFPPARRSQTSQKTSSSPSASGSTTSSGTASSRASSEAQPETEEDGILVQDRRRFQALQRLQAQQGRTKS